MNKSFEEQIQILLGGTIDVLPLNDFKKKILKQKSLIIKLGADPTAPNLHLGHAVILNKLRQFQDFGHKIVFLIGDFTARIGDPTGKSKTRPPLTEEEILINTQTYINQIGKILDINKTEIRYNSEWLSSINLDFWLKILGKVTLARVIEREDFKKRLSENSPIGMHEIMYPLLQGYDSVALKADVELGGTDQTFNLLMGRHLQEQSGFEPQVILTMPLLEGLDGVQKMSKSLKNDIGLMDTAEDVFGKIMSLPDFLILKYFKLLLSKTSQELLSIDEMHKKEAKKLLAYEILSKYWSKNEADQGKKYFEDMFEKKEYQELAEIRELDKKEYLLIELIHLMDPSLSNTEIKRLILSNSILINHIKKNDFKENIKLENNHVIKIGKKRIYKIIIKN